MKNKFFSCLFLLITFTSINFSQSFLMQGWYWDYPKTPDGNNWANTLETKAEELAAAGFTHIWLPPLSRTSSGNYSNGYDPKDLYDLGEFGQGYTQFGTRTDVDDLISEFDLRGIKAVADVVYNHRDGGLPENNGAVEGWIQNYSADKVNSGDNPYPSDRFRCVLPIGGSTGKGTGTYYFKIRSASKHSDFYYKKYKVYMWTDAVGWQGLPDVNETEPNGGGDCGQGNNAISLGRNYWAWIDDDPFCGVDEFALTLNSGDYNSSGDNIYIILSNDGGYSDHYIYGIWYTGTSNDVQADLEYQTYTDFTSLPSGQGSMNYLNFKPNGNPTQLAGDWDWMWFYYDYDQNVATTKTVLYDWTRWLWNDVGIRGYRMDAVKHFPPEFVGDMLDNLYDNSLTPDLVVGEFYDANSASLKYWIDQVYLYMDNDTKTAITPRIFDFALRDALKGASDVFQYDARNVFDASLVDAQGVSGFNTVTFVNNHDFRDPGQPVTNDPILAYAYILTNNQVGLPCVYYTDYYAPGDLKTEIDQLIDVHKDYIYGATGRDYLTRFSSPYPANYIEGYETTSLIYQLTGTPSTFDVIVAINYSGGPLKVDIGINMSGIKVGDTFSDVIGNSAYPYATVSGSGQIYIELPARSYSVWVEDPVPQPVELSLFEAEITGTGVILKWRTETEIDNFGFDIERKKISDENPVSEWNKIAFVPGSGNSNAPVEYSYSDMNIRDGRYLYRLKQIDNNGKFEYSIEKEITIGMTEGYFLRQNYPNPFNPSTVINFGVPENERAELTVYDAIGRKVKTLFNGVVEAGKVYSAHFAAGGLPSGVYYYKLETPNYTETRKMLLLK